MLIDQNERDDIIMDNGSIMVSASAGSGKTTIMIDKIKKVLKEITDHRTIAAITFTNKATKEIQDKADDKGVEKSFVASTNNGFVEMEIIRPFIKDALGDQYRSEFIIEFDRNFKFRKTKEGLEQLKVHNVMGTYRNNKKNFIFELALIILDKSRASREYLQAKYEMIFIDEYQDSDNDMHNLFMYFYEHLNLKLFIVGDEKQAIYHWRGAEEEIFEKIPSTFNKYSLVKNFRCHNDIINYANLLYEPKYFTHDRQTKTERVIHMHNHDVIFSVTYLIGQGKLDITKEITIIARYNNEAQNYANAFQSLGYNFIFIPRTPLDEGTPNSHILIEVAKYLIQETYSVYDLIVQTNQDEELIVVSKLKKLLQGLKKEIEEQSSNKQLENCCNYLGVSITEDEIKRFHTTIEDKSFHIAFEDRDDLHQIMTVFSSKGLEFDQVISKSSYYGISRSTELQNHYVCITRAKKKLVMLIDDSNYETFIDRQAKQLGMSVSDYLYTKV